MWTTENTYHTYLHILQKAAKGHLVGGGVGTPYILPPDPPLQLLNILNFK